jgi:hypothetical protein
MRMQEHVRYTSCKLKPEERSFIVVDFNFYFIICHSRGLGKPEGLKFNGT